MSRIALATLTGPAAFAAAGLASGALLDTDGGAAGALEWVLRTVVVVAAAVALAGASVLVLRLRRHVRGPRPIGWVVAAAVWVAFAWFVAIPAAYAVYLTHLPARKAVADADLGAPKQAVTLTGADGVHIRGWYVPSRNGAAVIALHGTGGSRASMVPHARMLV